MFIWSQKIIYYVMIQEDPENERHKKMFSENWIVLNVLKENPYKNDNDISNKRFGHWS